jgi:hypothetical protein
VARFWPLLFWTWCHDKKMVIWCFGNFMVSRGNRRDSCEVEERKIWTFIVGVMVIQGNLFIWEHNSQYRKHRQIFLYKKKENCAMLGRSLSTREALVHPFQLLKWKIWKTKFWEVWATHFGKKLWTLFAGWILTIFILRKTA